MHTSSTDFSSIVTSIVLYCTVYMQVQMRSSMRLGGELRHCSHPVDPSAWEVCFSSDLAADKAAMMAVLQQNAIDSPLSNSWLE